MTFEPAIESAVDLGRIKGQKLAQEAAVISAAGQHNMLLIGPPGEGKSLIASAIPGILPRLANEEKVELTRIYSACDKLSSPYRTIFELFGERAERAQVRSR